MGRRGRKKSKKRRIRGGYRRQRERRRRDFPKDYDLLPPFVFKTAPVFEFESETYDKPNIRHRTETVRARSRNIGFIKSFWTDSRIIQVCKNRRKRREVLFAKGRAGKGRSGPKLRKYTEESKVRC